MNNANSDLNIESLIESCKPVKKRGRPSHKRQLQEIRAERKINLQTSDSVVTATNLKTILTLETLQTLPAHCQDQLIRLLPELDQILDEGSGCLRASETALNNEHFARFCSQYLEKLSDNKLSDKSIEQARTDTLRELAKLDPWKLKNFEPIWGKKLASQSFDTHEDVVMLNITPTDDGQTTKKAGLLRKRRRRGGISHLSF